MTLRVHNETSLFLGAQKFANNALRAYLINTKDRKEDKFVELRALMQSDMWLTDLRQPINPYSDKASENSHQFDIVGFRNEEPVCFTMRCDGNLQVKGFIQTTLDQMSENSQQMIHNIMAHSNERPRMGG